MSADYVWGGLIAAGATYEAYALFNTRKEDTLSELTRATFRTRSSKAGRYSFLVAWTVFATWFTGHIMDWWW